MTRLLTVRQALVGLGLLIAAAAVGLVAGLAHAATLTRVAYFGSNPGGLNMYIYRPDGLPAGRPLVVAMHGCTQNAATFHAYSGWRKYADRWGFAVVYPERIDATTFPSNCFTWFTAAHTTRGQGQALSVSQMVDHAVANYGADASRVYVTGLSAGGAMAAAMLATYPDKFAGGSVVAGLPYRCAPPSTAAICMSMGVDKTPQQWGDLVRGAYPGYSGRRAKVAVWHGQADYVVVARNGLELRDQWTNVAGVAATPASTRTLPANTTLEIYGSDVVRLYKVGGMGHGQPVDPGTGTEQCGTAGAYFLDTICAAYHDAGYFGLGGA